MGHPSHNSIMKISSLIGVSFNKDFTLPCDVCYCRAKRTRATFDINKNKESRPFALIHCDLWGRYKTPSTLGAHYFLTIMDDYSLGVWVYLLKEKSETCNLIKNFCAMVENKFGLRIQKVRSDNGTEFMSSCLQSYYKQRGIICETSCAGTPQQNGRVEKKHRHILNVDRALRFQANLPLAFWGDCVLTAAHLINRTPMKANEGRTPYELLFNNVASYSHLRTLGCLCYERPSHGPKDKFGERRS